LKDDRQNEESKKLKARKDNLYPGMEIKKKSSPKSKGETLNLFDLCMEAHPEGESWASNSQRRTLMLGEKRDSYGVSQTTL
jgi:hypothetical protein